MSDASPSTDASTAAATGSPAEEVVSGFKNLIRDEIPSARDIVFEGLSRSAGGLSRENWSLDATWTDRDGPHSHRMMLMRDAVGTLLKSERSREFAVLKALEGSRVPAPAVYFLDPDGRFLGTPSVVMERVPGHCDYMVLNGGRPLEDRLALALGFIELMANMHMLDWRALGLGDVLGVPEGSPARKELRFWEEEYRSVQLEPHPELDYILAWLGRTAPDAEALVLVHGDFKPGNALVEGTRITAKLDWETAHISDPLEDLGWVTNPVRKREHQIPGHWERKEIVDAYARLTGRPVDDKALTWWNVFSCWKLAVIQLTAVNEFVAGRYSRVFQTPSWLFRPMFQMMEAVR